MRLKTEQAEKTAAERAVDRYESAQATLDAYIRDVRDIMIDLQQLVEDRNAALDAAQRAVKQQLLQGEQDKLVVRGFGAQKKISRWYDGELLARELPESQADLILKEEIIWHVNVETLQQLLRQGEIDSGIVQLAYHEEAPTASLMPGAPKPYTLPVVPLDEEEEWPPQRTEEESLPPSEERKKSHTKISKGRKR